MKMRVFTYSTHWLQIDELVVQALQLTSNNGRKEIKQFADVLSATQTSLKVDLLFGIVMFCKKFHFTVFQV